MSSPTLRPLSGSDGPGVAAFLESVPSGERRFFKERVRDADRAVGEWLEDPRERHVVATVDEEIVGLGVTLQQTGWSSHVAELRVVVSPSQRRRGVGRELARRALLGALELGCTHVHVEVVAGQDALVAMFKDLGFEPEALLADFVRDSAGEYHDLMVLTHRVDENWAGMEAVGVGAPRD